MGSSLIHQVVLLLSEIFIKYRKSTLVNNDGKSAWIYLNDFSIPGSEVIRLFHSHLN